MTKYEVIEAIQQHLNEQLHDLQMSIDAVTESIVGEEKSSAGDKYETARAMNHNELERLNASYQKVLKSVNVIKRLPKSENHQTVKLGSLVKTAKRQLFFCAAIGKVEVGGQMVLTMSMGSPIGQVFLGKQIGDEVVFNNMKEEIVQLN